MLHNMLLYVKSIRRLKHKFINVIRLLYDTLQYATFCHLTVYICYSLWESNSVLQWHTGRQRCLVGRQQVLDKLSECLKEASSQLMVVSFNYRQLFSVGYKQAGNLLLKWYVYISGNSKMNGWFSFTQSNHTLLIFKSFKTYISNICSLVIKHTMYGKLVFKYSNLWQMLILGA